MHLVFHAFGIAAIKSSFHRSALEAIFDKTLQPNLCRQKESV